MATIVMPGTDRLTVDAANLAKHYGVEIAVCPPRRAQRKGVVETADQYLTKRVVADRARDLAGRGAGALDALVSVEVADAASAARRDGRRDRRRGAARGRCRRSPTRRVITVARRASRSALVGFDGNRYSVPPAHAGRTVTVHRPRRGPD